LPSWVKFLKTGIIPSRQWVNREFPKIGKFSYIVP
jgi:hypothetical protein